MHKNLAISHEQEIAERLAAKFLKDHPKISKKQLIALLLEFLKEIREDKRIM